MEIVSNQRWRSGWPAEGSLPGFLVGPDDACADRIACQTYTVTHVDLLKDVVEVGLHGDLGDGELHCDLGVAHSECHLADDLTLPRGEFLGHRLAQLRRELSLECRWHPRVSVGDGSDRCHQRLDGEPLEYDRASPGPQRAERILWTFTRRPDH